MADDNIIKASEMIDFTYTNIELNLKIIPLRFF